MVQGLAGNFNTAQQPGHFFQAFFGIEWFDRRACATPADRFGDFEMIITELGDLGQMRDANHLVMVR